jgi:class 3 adenylate cyclase/YHS domain-containing protein/DNA-binding transcriptional MerR regulator
VADDISIDDLASLTGESADTLRQWQRHGLIGDVGGPYTTQDVLRCRVVQLVLRRGLQIETIAEANRRNPFIDRDIRRLYPRGLTERYTLEQAAERAGVTLDWATRYVEAGNIADEEGFLRGDDVAAIRAGWGAVEAGFPEPALLQTLRVYADSMQRSAEAGQRAFHVYVHQRLLAAGLEPAQAIEGTQQVAGQTTSGAEALLMYLYRKSWTTALGDDIALHVLEDTGAAPVPDVPGEVSRAVLFTDLSSYTPMVEAMGDSAAAEVLERFSRIVRDAARRGLGQVVKQIGDAFMLVFPAAVSSVRAALEIEDRASAEPQFPAVRSGIHFGRVIYREADYVGTVPNVASRLITEAQRHQVLVTASVRDEAKQLADAEFVPLGRRTLKGLPEAVELFEVRRAAVEPQERSIDPVCGMELSSAEVASSLTRESHRYAFCSDKCLGLFVAAPERYAKR